ncbi:MAG: amino acid permease, partial [Lactobacillus iners]|nr:amino acid permease [Lactobacillus iners]
TAAEAQDPKNTIARAIDQLPIRIILFYVIAIVAILVAIPWPKISTTSSPFVQALSATGIKNAGSIINFVVISAAISSTNSFLYSAGRLLFSVNFDGKSKWSKTFGKLSKTQVPRNALIFSSLIIACAPLITLIIGDSAFTFISSTSTSMFLIIWAIMIVTHIRYRKETANENLKSFQMPLFPYLDYLVLAFFVAMIALLLYLDKFRIPMMAALVTFVILYSITKFIREKNNN